MLSYALSGGEAPDVSGADYRLLYGFAAMHGVEGLLYRALHSVKDASVPPEVEAALKKASERSFARAARLSAEEDAVLRALDGEGIDCMPVKGSQIAECYPSPELRAGCDVDILISPEQKRAAERLMLSRGFACRERGVTERTYIKAPNLVFELHTALQEGALPRCLTVGINENTPGNGAHIYRMSNENAYVYLLCHAAKHLRSAGCGVRFALDSLAMRRKYSLDFEYINTALDEVGLRRFGQSVIKLCDFWFEGAPADADTERLARFVLSSGSYGSPENAAIIKRMNEPEQSRARHFFRRLFPPYKQMVRTRPYLKKCPVLLPLSWVGRIIRSSPVIGRKKREETAAYDEADEKRVAEMRALFDSVGIIHKESKNGNL